MTQKYIEIADSSLFLSHFYGPAGAPAHAGFTVDKIYIPSALNLPEHTKAAGSVYAGQLSIGDDGVAFVFDLTDGVDVVRMPVRRENLELPGLYLTAE